MQKEILTPEQELSKKFFSLISWIDEIQRDGMEELYKFKNSLYAQKDFYIDCFNDPEDDKQQVYDELLYKFKAYNKAMDALEECFYVI